MASSPLLQHRCLILGNGAAGAENQCIGLAERLGLPFDVVRIPPSPPWAGRLPAALHVWLGRAVAAMSAALVPISSAQQKYHGHRFWGFDTDAIDSLILAKRPPSLVIASGRSTAALSVMLRRHWKESVPTVQIQHPRVATCNFDVVVTPRHDYTTTASAQGLTVAQPEAANVVLTTGTVNRVRPQLLTAAASSSQARSLLDLLPPPRIAVLVGGGTDTWTMSCAYVEALMDRVVEAAAASHSGAVMVLTSRRTPPACVAALRARCDSERLKGGGSDGKELTDPPRFFFWDPGMLDADAGADHDDDHDRDDSSSDAPSFNPYLACLSVARLIVVTPDSVSMVSEACAAAVGASVYVADERGGGATGQLKRKLQFFHAHLRSAGHARPLSLLLSDLATPVPGGQASCNDREKQEDQQENYENPHRCTAFRPLQDTDEVAAAIREHPRFAHLFGDIPVPCPKRAPPRKCQPVEKRQ